jgi:hypothetical protein
MATKKTTLVEEPVEEIKEETAEEKVTDPGEELVTIQLFKDNDRYRDDLYVAVNGERILIQRGVPVTLKRKFAEVIQHSERQDQRTDALMQRMADDYVRKTEESTRL